jgi:hypothetical protein
VYPAEHQRLDSARQAASRQGYAKEQVVFEKRDSSAKVDVAGRLVYARLPRGVIVGFLMLPVACKPQIRPFRMGKISVYY